MLLAIRPFHFLATLLMFDFVALLNGLQTNLFSQSILLVAAVRAEGRHTSRLSAVVRLSTLLRLPILLSLLEVKLTLHCLIVLALTEMSQVRLRKILDNNWLADCDGLRHHRIGDGQPTHSRLAGELQFLLEWSLDLRLGVQLRWQLQTQTHVLHC